MKIISTLIYLILSFTATAQVNEIMRLTYFGGRQEKETGICGMKWAVDNSPRIPLTGNHPVKLEKDKYTLNLPGRSAGIYFISREKVKATEELIITAKCTPRANSFKINNDSLVKAPQEKKASGLQVRSKAVAKLGNAGVFRLSCYSSYSGPDPIYVVDGTILPNINDVNNENIEDITALPAPQAQAIFGPQGKHGAIVIKLKMRYDKIIIKDILDKAPIAKATVSFVFPERKDTLRYIADDSGVIVSNSLPKLEGCEMIVSAIGYKNDTRTFRFDKTDPLNEVLLTRDVKECNEVILSSIICRRIGCGWGCRVIRRKEPLEIPVSPAVSFKVYPNPVDRGGVINFQFTTKEEGLMHVKVVSLDGKSLLHQAIKTVKGVNNLSLNTGINWAAGIYFVQLLYENGRLAASGKIVVQ